MAQIFEFEGKRPRISPTAFVAPTATLIGDVEIADGASVWFGAVLRGDVGIIRVGPNTNIQDNCVLHTDPDTPTIIGEGVTVGHAAVLEGCIVEDRAVIGMQATLLQRSRVGEGAMVAAGSVVGEGMQIPAGTLAAGVPAQVKKPLGGAAQEWVAKAAAEYRHLAQRYLRQFGPDS